MTAPQLSATETVKQPDPPKREGVHAVALGVLGAAPVSSSGPGADQIRSVIKSPQVRTCLVSGL
ncbi:hypothetical protein P3T27_001342 [Kitasatospora sp. MAA19]|nr:hypothetical protein [Kitasatospora sp. MAA19]